MASTGEPATVSEGPKSTLSSYYEALDAGDLEALARCFVEDAVLVVPDRGGELRPRHGHGEILEFFRRRGATGDRHTVTTIAETEGRFLVEGILALAAGNSQPFLASVRFAGDDRIARYLVFSAPGPADALAACIDRDKDTAA
jgi:hypothetical protein